MRNFILSIVFLWTPFLHAQESKIYETPTGFFVRLGNDLPRNFTYRISRRHGDESFVKIAEVGIPSTQEEYRQRLHLGKLQFAKLAEPNENQIEHIWEQISKSSAGDRLPFTSQVIETMAVGLAWHDTIVQNGRTYQYKIERVADGQITASQLTERKVYVTPTEVELPMPVFFKHNLYLENLNMRWLLLRKKGIAGIEVFRQDNLRGDYRLISIPIGYAQNLDSTFVHVDDTLAEKYQVYEYKLRPFDQFGNPGAFSKVTKIVNITQNDFPFLRSFNAVALKDRQIKLKWSMDFKPFIRSIKILRSMSFDSAFVEIGEVSPRDSTYIDILPVSMENYYYRLKINGPENVSISTSSTFVLYESDLEPDPPTGLTASEVEGGVQLEWEDHQRNVFGYYIFRRESDSGFIQVSDPIHFNKDGKYQYTDTTTSLHGDRFYDYTIKTISDSYVLSQFSDTLSARPGIVVPIAAPKNFRGRGADGKVYLFWDDLSFSDKNLMGYKLFRKGSYEDNFTVLHDSLLNANINHFIDSTVQLGYAYQYMVKSYNYFGSESDTSKLLQFQFYLNLPTPPPNIKAQKISEGIRIVWGEVLANDIGSFRLYKYREGEKPVLVSTLPADRHDFLDSQVTSGQLYFYYVTSSNKHEIEGRPSEAVTVRY